MTRRRIERDPHIWGTPRRAVADRSWVDLDDKALAELDAKAGDPVMVSTPDGDNYPGVLVHDGVRYAIWLDDEVPTQRVFVRRRGIGVG